MSVFTCSFFFKLIQSVLIFSNTLPWYFLYQSWVTPQLQQLEFHLICELHLLDWNHVNVLYQHDFVRMILAANPQCATKYFIGRFTSYLASKPTLKGEFPVGGGRCLQVAHANPWNNFTISFCSHVENLTKIPWLSFSFLHCP